MANDLFVKYCPACEAENIRNAAFCHKCMDSLSNTPISRRHETESTSSPTSTSESGMTPNVAGGTKRVKEAVCILELLENPHLQFLINDGQTVGRTNAADVVLNGVPHSDYISSLHARFFRRGTQWYVQHIGSTNYIKVDGEEYEDDTEVAIDHNAILTLSLTTFTIKLDGKA